MVTARRAGPVARAVAASLRVAPAAKRDAGAVALVKAYATLIDDAASPERYRKDLDLLRRSIDPDHVQAHDAFAKISAALSSHTVASDLGPKLLAALAALHLTAAARGRIEGGKVSDPVADELAELRERHSRRGTGQPDPEDRHTAAP